MQIDGNSCKRPCFVLCFIFVSLPFATQSLDRERGPYERETLQNTLHVHALLCRYVSRTESRMDANTWSGSPKVRIECIIHIHVYVYAH